MDGMRPANINGLPEGIEAYFGTPQGQEQLFLYLFCIHCRNNGTAEIFPNGQFAMLKRDHTRPWLVAQSHVNIFRHAVKK